jgi:hypothetical protein
LQFLGHARGSLTELVTQLEICAEREYISATELKSVETKAFNVFRLLNALMESLRTKVSAKGKEAQAKHLFERSGLGHGLNAPLETILLKRFY